MKLLPQVFTFVSILIGGGGQKKLRYLGVCFFPLSLSFLICQVGMRWWMTRKEVNPPLHTQKCEENHALGSCGRALPSNSVPSKTGWPAALYHVCTGGTQWMFGPHPERGHRSRGEPGGTLLICGFSMRHGWNPSHLFCLKKTFILWNAVKN